MSSSSSSSSTLSVVDTGPKAETPSGRKAFRSSGGGNQASNNSNTTDHQNHSQVTTSSDATTTGTETTTTTTTSSSSSGGPDTTASALVTSTEALDFIGSSHAVKDLFSVPYTAGDRTISVAVHNLGGTLLIDADPELDAQKQGRPIPETLWQSTTTPQGGETPASTSRVTNEKATRDEGSGNHTDEEEEMTRSLVALSSLEPSNEALMLVNSIVQSQSSLHNNNNTVPSDDAQEGDSTSPSALHVPKPDDYTHRFFPPCNEPREYLTWNFHDMNLLLGSNALIYRGTTTSTAGGGDAPPALSVRVEDAKEWRALLERHQQMVQSGEFVADHRFAKLQQMGKPTYADATRRSVQDVDHHNESNNQDEAVTAASETESSQSRQGGSFAAPDLDQVRLQTCRVPSSSLSVGGVLARSSEAGLFRVADSNMPTTKSPSSTSSSSGRMSPVSTVIDTYLDNIMANVPQLALCLREKGFIQSVKLLSTEEIPTGLMHPSTLDTSKPFEIIRGSSSSSASGSSSENIFSPQVMEMNASALLRFLKDNCTKDHATYLLRREVGHANIQLYDITAISAQGQRKWIWWLAMMSYRFAHRLRDLAVRTADPSLKRSFRARHRSLLQNTLELLETLADMNGKAHESLIAAIHENLADTFLGLEEQDVSGLGTTTATSSPESNMHPQGPPTVTAASTQQPYGSIAPDSLNKAQDLLADGIKTLWPVLNNFVQSSRQRKQRKKSPPVNVVSIGSGDSDEDDYDDDDEEDDGEEKDVLPQDVVGPVVTQLFGLHEKLVSVSLRLAEIHLKNYFSSSAMQALRTAARRLANALYLSQLVVAGNPTRTQSWVQGLRLQYTWLWEHCGHFARSFAADEHWRDRGYASGDDVVSVLQDVEAAFLEHEELRGDNKASLKVFLRPKQIGGISMVNLHSLSGIALEDQAVPQLPETSVEEARQLLKRQHVLVRDQRVALVSACIAYHRAIEAFRDMDRDIDGNRKHDTAHESPKRALLELLQQRLGDACNETGKLMLNELRHFLGSGAAAGKYASETQSITAAEPLLSSSQFWFLQGLAAFEECSDLRNLALLRCNLCQCWKLRANGMFVEKNDESNPSHAETCLQEAANHLQAAHETLGQRDVDPHTWDMVSSELAATYLVLGVRRRQSLIGSGNTPVILHALRLSPGKERSIVDPMERALSIYQLSGNQHQAAATHYQLALFYSKIWTCQRDEVKTREKLSAAFQHYNSSYSYFSQAIRGNEATFCLLCLDLSNLCSAVSGLECLNEALVRCLQTVDAFSGSAIQAAYEQPDPKRRKEWFEKMDTLASSVEDRVFKLVRNLVKIQEESPPLVGEAGAEVPKVTYKELYRVGLQAKMAKPNANESVSHAAAQNDTVINPIVERLDSVHRVLSSIRTCLKPTVERI